MFLAVILLTTGVLNGGSSYHFEDAMGNTDAIIGESLTFAPDSLHLAPVSLHLAPDSLHHPPDSLHLAPEHSLDSKVSPLGEKTEPVVLPSYALQDMRIEVDINKRMLYVFSGDQEVAYYPVAVGKPEWPTRTGNWRIYEVVWNPWWHPPDQEWAWYRPIMAPGDPDNPLGRAQLIYDAPRSIHGTIEPSSIGRAVSHGSIRVTNETAMLLARKVMESAGIVHDEQWYEEVTRDRSKNVRIPLSQKIPIRVHGGR